MQMPTCWEEKVTFTLVDLVGNREGVAEGAAVGAQVGVKLGPVGNEVGATLGADGFEDGALLGSIEGPELAGPNDGFKDGNPLDGP